MTPHDLIAQWRKEAGRLEIACELDLAAAMDTCADDLEAALAAAPSISEDHEMAKGCLNMIADQLEKLGTDMSKTPPMFYPEAICTTVWKYAAPWKLKGEPAPSLLTDAQREALEAADKNWCQDSAQWDTMEELFTPMGVWPQVHPHLIRYLLAADAKMREEG